MPAYNKMTVKQLEAARARIEVALHIQREKERAAIAAAIVETCESAGFSVADVLGAPIQRRKPPIIHPTTGKQWHRIGRPPAWVRELNGATS